MILHNVTIAASNRTIDVRVKDGKIDGISSIENKQRQITPIISFTDAIIFPGLINSHEHLDFNLFPKLGNKTYSSYTVWGNYIHQHYASEIRSILKIPIILRESWGIYKNLLCGVTTVVNHGEKTQLQKKLINVLEDEQSLHSVQFEKKWKYKLNNPFKINKKVVIHVGEGIDKAAQDEVSSLIKWNLLRRNLIAIHGVAVKETQAKSFEAVVWCPQSNQFLLNCIADVKRLKQHTKILFGTDSTLTSNWNIWDHIRTARKTKMLTDLELYGALNIVAANTWKTNIGSFNIGNDADLVLAKRKNHENSLNAFFDLDPADILMVMRKGEILLFDESLKNQLIDLDFTDFCRFTMNGSSKYVIGDLNSLINEIKKYQPAALFPNELVL